jgi:hypothetical protein
VSLLGRRLQQRVLNELRKQASLLVGEIGGPTEPPSGPVAPTSPVAPPGPDDPTMTTMATPASSPSDTAARQGMLPPGSGAQPPDPPSVASTGHAATCQMTATGRLDGSCERCRAILTLGGS